MSVMYTLRYSKIYLNGFIFLIFRDTFIYAASVENTGLDKAIEILGDVTLRPQLSENEVSLYSNF